MIVSKPTCLTTYCGKGIQSAIGGMGETRPSNLTPRKIRFRKIMGTFHVSCLLRIASHQRYYASVIISTAHRKEAMAAVSRLARTRHHQHEDNGREESRVFSCKGFSYFLSEEKTKFVENAILFVVSYV